VRGVHGSQLHPALNNGGKTLPFQRAARACVGGQAVCRAKQHAIPHVVGLVGALVFSLPSFFAPAVRALVFFSFIFPFLPICCRPTAVPCLLSSPLLACSRSPTCLACKSASFFSSPHFFLAACLARLLLAFMSLDKQTITEHPTGLSNLFLLAEICGRRASTGRRKNF
jgi:hypothetical protein